jgi:hypothetical protein
VEEEEGGGVALCKISNARGEVIVGRMRAGRRNSQGKTGFRWFQSPSFADLAVISAFANIGSREYLR